MVLCNHNVLMPSLLVLAGKGLIFFLVVCVALCFGLVMKAVLITHKQSPFKLRLSSAYTILRPSLWVVWGCTTVWEGTSDPSWPERYSTPYDVLSNKNLGGRRRNWGAGSYSVFSPNNHYTRWSPAFLERIEDLLCGWEVVINSLICFTCMHGFCSTY